MTSTSLNLHTLGMHFIEEITAIDHGISFSYERRSIGRHDTKGETHQVGPQEMVAGENTHPGTTGARLVVYDIRGSEIPRMWNLLEKNC